MMSKNTFTWACIVSLCAGTGWAQDESTGLLWLGVAEVSSTPVCAFSNKSTGVLVYVQSENVFSTRTQDGGTPASVTVNVENVANIEVTQSSAMALIGVVPLPDPNIFFWTTGSYDGSQLIGAASSTLTVGADFTQVTFIDTPDAGSDTFDLELAGRVAIAEAVVPGATYQLANSLDCYFSAS